MVIGTSRDTATQTFQIYSSDTSLYTTIDKDKALVYSWGLNGNGQLGLNDTESRSVPTILESMIDYSFKDTNCGAFHSGILEQTGRLFVCGNNAYGQMGSSHTEELI